jgi:hypothetical protein
VVANTLLPASKLQRAREGTLPSRTDPQNRAAKRRTQIAQNSTGLPLSFGQSRLTIPNLAPQFTKSASLCSDCCSPSLRNAVRLPYGIDVHLHLHRNTHARHSGIIVQEDPAMGEPNDRTDHRFGDVSAEARRTTERPTKFGNVLFRTGQLTASIKHGTRKHIFCRVVRFVLRNPPPTDRASVPKVRIRAPEIP